MSLSFLKIKEQHIPHMSSRYSDFDTVYIMCTCTMWLLSSSVFMVLKQKQRALEKSNILVCMTKFLYFLICGVYSQHTRRVFKKEEKKLSQIYTCL